MEEEFEDRNVEEVENKIVHKVEVGKEIIVYANEWNGKILYNTPIYQKQIDGTSKRAYLPIRFKKDVVLDNGTTIIIKNGFENFTVSPKDKNGYYPRFYIQINDFEIVENSTSRQDAFTEYAEETAASDDIDLPF